MTNIQANVDQEYRKERLQEFLLSHIDKFKRVASQYQWPWEVRRWHELAFALLTTVSSPPLKTDRARALIYIFADLGLLNIESLASALPARQETEAQRAFDTAVFLLEREGLSSEDAQRAMTVIAEAAASLHTRFNGKIQGYLRTYGERMLAEIGEHFTFAQLSNEERIRVFTLWFQNVLNMPLSMATPAIQNICSDFGVDFHEMLEVADELGLNLALIDDVATDIEGLAKSEVLG